MGKSKDCQISGNFSNTHTDPLYQLKAPGRCFVPEFKVLKVAIFINRLCHKLELKLDVKAAPHIDILPHLKEGDS
jgi:hypothetical protein